MLVVVCADKGAPGVTSTALTLASCWPAHTVLVEADPSGGSLGMRLQSGGSRLVPAQYLPAEPTVLTLAAASRGRESDPDLLMRHAHALSDQVAVVPGFLGAEQGSELGTAWQSLAEAIARSDYDVVVDVGRIDARSPVLPLAAAADAVVVVARPRMEQVIGLATRVGELGQMLGRMRGRSPILYPVLVTARRQARAAVCETTEHLTAAAVHAQPVSAIGWDPASLSRLERGGDPDSGVLRRTVLLRTGREVASRIHGYAGADYTQVRRGDPRTPQQRAEPGTDWRLGGTGGV